MSNLNSTFDINKIKDREKVKYALEPLDIPQNIMEMLQKTIDDNKVLVDDINILKMIVAAIVSGHHIILYGPVGTGKTELVRLLVDIFHCELEVTTAGENWDSPDYLLGSEQYIAEKGFKFIEGSLVKSIKRTYQYIYYDTISAYKATESSAFDACWLLIDEINRGDVNRYLSSLMTALEPIRKNVTEKELKEKYKISYLQEEKEEILYMPKRLRIIGTMNTFDKNVLYKLPFALKGRRFALIPINVPQSLERESEIIKASLEVDFPLADKALLNDFVAFIKGFIEKNREIKLEIGTGVYIDIGRLVFEMQELDSTAEIEDNIDLAVAMKIIPLLQDIEIGIQQKMKRLLEAYGLKQSKASLEELTRDITLELDEDYE
ncbi:MoxR-like ATPase [Natronincola peptidivorans]|uniref:MoxR-like ATPase n=1 Tax=Natronincola peptidivorans TaxID=426128 RepID=A0A1I0DY89_9FIRM|nr:AAA family ATPase [Natronincola peptidivorans]SET37513.1 MoxR-like ATPase [Natronincola peptidivorans]